MTESPVGQVRTGSKNRAAPLATWNLGKDLPPGFPLVHRSKQRDLPVIR
jgi:hypothetical protein